MMHPRPQHEAVLIIGWWLFPCVQWTDWTFVGPTPLTDPGSRPCRSICRARSIPDLGYRAIWGDSISGICTWRQATWFTKPCLSHWRKTQIACKVVQMVLTVARELGNSVAKRTLLHSSGQLWQTFFSNRHHLPSILFDRLGILQGQMEAQLVAPWWC